MSIPIIAAIVWALILGVGGGLLTSIGPWYRGLVKPVWQPPDWLFGPAWTLILGLAAWAGVVAWTAARSPGERWAVIILYLVNGVFHFAWSPLFFTAKRPDWALVEVVFLWVSLVMMIATFWRFAPFASLLIAPYLAWVSFAAVLNLAIVRLNAPFGGPASVGAQPPDILKR